MACTNDLVRLSNYKFENNIIGSEDMMYYDYDSEKYHSHKKEEMKEIKRGITKGDMKPRYHYINENKKEMPEHFFQKTIQLKKTLRENIVRYTIPYDKELDELYPHTYKNVRFENEKDT